MDAQTFIHLIVLGFKGDTLPKAWRPQPFCVFVDLTDRLRVKPLGDDYSPLFKGRDNDENKKRAFVNWKKLMTYFILLQSKVPDQQ